MENRLPPSQTKQVPADGITARLSSQKAVMLNARKQLQKYLSKVYPQHFGKDPRPWSLALHTQLLRKLEGEFSAQVIRDTLAYVARSKRYLTCCVLWGVGAARVDLHGKRDGKITRREMIYTLNQLVGLTKQHNALQSERYAQWLEREIVLGIMRAELTRSDLTRAKIRNKYASYLFRVAKEDSAAQTYELLAENGRDLCERIAPRPYLSDSLVKVHAAINDKPKRLSKPNIGKSKGGLKKTVGKPTILIKRKRRTTTLAPEMIIPVGQKVETK